MNVLLGFSPLERDRIPATINGWLAERGLAQLVPTWDRSRCCGGNKHMEHPLHAAVIDGLPVMEFLAFLRGLPWHEPHAATVMLWDAEVQRWRLVRP